jgi:hypothetical protein
MSFNNIFKTHSTDVSKTFGFEITAFPPVKPKYSFLERSFKKSAQVFYEDGYGGYCLERLSSSLEAKVILTPNHWEEDKKDCTLVFTYTDLSFKNKERKEVVKFGENISSQMRWKHKIVWFTDDGDKTIWMNCDEKEKK